MTLGHLTFRQESGLSFDVLDAFRLPAVVILLLSSMMLFMSMVGLMMTDLSWTI
jgi:hypothetical protein